MIQTPLSPHCDCCGLPISPQSGEDCLRCNYPVSRSKEERFLEFSLRDLQRVEYHGGANLTISGLIRRYQMRLNYLRQLNPGVVSLPRMTAPQQVAPSLPPVLPEAVPPKNVPSQPAASQVEKQAQIALPLQSPPTPPSRLEPPAPPKVPAMSVMPAVATTPVQGPQRPPRRTFSFSWRSFVVDQAITIIGLLGAFLILIGALSSVVTTGGNSFLSFLIVFGVHAFFGIAGVIAYRFANFRLIARIYTGIYTLLVPSVGFTSYNLVLGTHIPISVPTLVAVAAGYAAIVYVLLAVYERFPIYAYLGGMALIVADLAIAADLHLDFWWWPSILLLLAFPALISIARTSAAGRERFFTGSLRVLRQPVRVLMFTIAGVSLLGLVGTTLLSFLFDSFGAFVGVPGGAIRFSILSMTVLLLIWTGSLFWLTKRTRGVLVLAFMFLASVLAFCYASNFSQGGYALALVNVALLYHGLSRFAARFLQPFGKLGLNLDLIALVLVSIVPFISFLQLPQQLLFAAYSIPLDTHSPLYVQANWDAGAGLIAVGVGLLITVSVTLFRAKLPRTSGTLARRRNDWPWLLLLSGFLLNWEYSTIVLALNVTPVWCFVGLTLALVGIAVLVRERFGASWANPLDIVALGVILLTLVLSLGQGVDTIAALLLGFAALAYGVLLYQRRQRWLFLPLTFAVLALPQLISTRPSVVLLMGLLLPLLSVAIRRIMANRLRVVDLDPAKPKRAIAWEWPLLASGLLYGVIVSLFDVLSSGSAVSDWFAVTFHVTVAFPVALEMATLALAWYVSAALARVKWWLILVIGFAIAALLLPSDLFWVLVAVAPVAALLAFGISRRTDRIWASPLYIMALLSAVMVGIAGQNEGQLFAASWILLGFGLFAYVMGLAEDLEPCLWLLPVFAAWALIDAALLGDLYRPPTIALIFAGVGVAIGLLKCMPMPFLRAGQRNRLQAWHLGYALPFYTTAFAAAVLTGVYGMLPGARPPFYGAIPDALLVYALTAFGVILFERQPRWLWLVAGFATWGTLLATNISIYYVTGIGLGVGIVGLLLGWIVKQRVVDSALSGLAMSSSMRIKFKFSWGWPWYLAALVAAVVVGSWPFLSLAQPVVGGFIEYSLLAFAVLFYLVGIVEEQVPIMWIGSLLTTWSLIDSAFQSDFYRLLTITLVYTALAIVTRSLKFFPRIFGTRQEKTLLRYALPFYATAFIAAVAGGCDITFFGIHQLFNGNIPDALPLLVYAGMALGVLIFERQAKWLGLVAAFGIWGTLLAPRVTIDWVVGIVIGAVLAGMLMGRIIRQPLPNAHLSVAGYNLSRLTWGLPWYAIALVATIVTGVLAPWSIGAWAMLVFALLAYIVGVVEDLPGVLWLTPVFAAWSLIDFAQWNQFYPFPIVVLVGVASGVLTRLRKLPVFVSSVPGQQNRRLNYALPLYAAAFLATVLTGSFFGLRVNYPFYGAVAATMLLYAVVACGVMLFERVPETLILPVAFATVAVWLWQPQLNLASMMIAYSVLCILIFASQFVWKVLSPATHWMPASLLHTVLGIGGQLLVVLVIIGNNGLTAGSDLLAFVGAGALFVLTAMVFCYGRIQGTKVIQRACDYTAGLLVSLVVSWVLAAFQQMNTDLLLLAPATYLIVIAPLLLRDEALPGHQRIGQVLAVLGAALLLLPTLWLSFSNGDGNLLYTVVLMGEALVLLLLGIGVRVRSFVLSGTSLFVVGAIHALFLARNELSGTLTLIIAGVTLLAIATGLSIAGRRLRSAWAKWD